MDHALSCVARLVRLLLGPSSIANAKLEAAPELVVLGVYLIPSRRGLECWPSAEKVAALVF